MVVEKSDPPPYSSVDDIQQQRITVPAIPAVNRTRLLDGLSQARTLHLREIVTSKILPIVEQRAHFGLSHTEIALIPSQKEQSMNDARYTFDDESSLDHGMPILNKLDNIDAHSGFIQVQLNSPMDNPRFWNQKAVIEELRTLTLNVLTSDVDDGAVENPGTKVTLVDHSANTGTSRQSDVDSQLKSRARKSSRLSRLNSLIKNEMTMTKQSNVEASSGEHMHVKTEIQEVCVRTTNDYGLYESTTKEVVIVDVHIGSV